MTDADAGSRYTTLIEALTDLAHDDPDVTVLALYGSGVRPHEFDAWSDADVLVVVRDGAMARFFPTTAWLAPLGRVFAREQFSGDVANTTRVCFDDLRRLDLVIASESSARNVATWSHAPFATGLRVLLSRSAEISVCLAGPLQTGAYSPPASEQFSALTDGFWFRAVVAISKVVRDDRVIALHLALGLLQDACVLAMMLRDRATGTTQHKTGGIANDIVADFAGTVQPPTPLGILDLVESSARIFDHLASSWSTSYEPRFNILLPALGQARAQVAGR